MTAGALTIRLLPRRRRVGGELRRRRVDDLIGGRDDLRRIEVRVMRSDAVWLHADELLKLHGLELVDLNPPAAGPEAALIFRGRAEAVVRADVERAGVLVLASRELRPLLDG